MNGITSTRTIPTLTEGGKEFTRNMEKAELFADTFSQVSSNNNNTEEFRQHKVATSQHYQHLFVNDNESQDNTVLNSQFMLYELETAIRKARKNSAADDGKITIRNQNHIRNDTSPPKMQ